MFTPNIFIIMYETKSEIFSESSQAKKIPFWKITHILDWKDEDQWGNFRKRSDQNIMGIKLITKPCHNQAQYTEISES